MYCVSGSRAIPSLASGVLSSEHGIRDSVS
jgi:hypothetical protein